MVCSCCSLFFQVHVTDCILRATMWLSMLSLIDFQQKDWFPAQAIQVAEVETTMSDEES